MLRLSVLFASIVAAFVSCNVASAEEMKLIMTTIALPSSPISQQTYHAWADRINERNKGVLQIDVRDGTTLASSTNFYDRLLNDVMQISFGSLNYLAGKFRLAEVMGLPFVMDSSEQESVVFWRLYKSGLLDSEFDQIVPLFFQAFPQVSMHLVKAQPTALETLNGLKIIASGKIQTSLISALGGSPLSIPLTDSYQALQRNTADGMNFPIAALPDFKLDEVTTYHIAASLGGGPGGVWMAKAKYLSLPPEVRKILDENSGEAQSRQAGTILDSLQTKVLNTLKETKGQTVVSLTPQQLAAWKEKLEPLVGAWAGTDEAHAKVLKLTRELAAQVKAGK